MARAVHVAVVGLALACGEVLAQMSPVPPAEVPDFPSGAAPLESAMLQQRLSGKVFRVAPRAAPAWRLQFNDNGYWYINTESGYSDSGKWRVEGSTLCTEPRKTKASCNDIRLFDDALYLRRDSGEVVKFEHR